jgi:hypothetical protein
LRWSLDDAAVGRRGCSDLCGRYVVEVVAVAEGADGRECKAEEAARRGDAGQRGTEGRQHKNVDARRQAIGRRLCPREYWAERALGVFDHRHVAARSALSTLPSAAMLRSGDGRENWLWSALATGDWAFCWSVKGSR